MKRLGVLFFAAMAIILCDCTKPDPEPQPEPPVEETAYITLDNGQNQSVSAEYEGDEFPLYFNTNKNWTIDIVYGSGAPGWMSISAKSGKSGKQALIVTVQENTESAKRSAVITINAGDASENIVISQEAFKSEFSITPKSIEVTAEGGAVEVSVTSNIGYHASTSVDWIHEMSSKATQTKSMWFIVDSNESTEPRSGVIVICNDNEVCIPVTVNQDGQPAEDIFLELGAYTLEFDHQERCSQVKVTSNESWSAVSSASWCTAAKIASGNYLDVCVKANDTGKKRTAQITVKTDRGGVKKTLTVSQSAQEGNEDFGDDGQIKWD